MGSQLWVEIWTEYLAPKDASLENDSQNKNLIRVMNEQVKETGLARKDDLTHDVVFGRARKLGNSTTTLGESIETKR